MRHSTKIQLASLLTAIVLVIMMHNIYEITTKDLVIRCLFYYIIVYFLSLVIAALEKYVDGRVE